MKRFIFYLIFALTAFSACKKEDLKPSLVIDPDAKVRIECESTGLKSANSEHLTPLEVVKQATGMRCYNDSISENEMALGFTGKDTISETPAFLFYGSFIITPDGLGVPYLVPDYIYAYDIVIEIFHDNNNIDTIAYIPNSIMREAELNIINALNNQDTAAVYDIFRNAFKFVPITGVEWRELKSQGLN